MSYVLPPSHMFSWLFLPFVCIELVSFYRKYTEQSGSRDRCESSPLRSDYRARWSTEPGHRMSFTGGFGKDRGRGQTEFSLILYQGESGHSPRPAVTAVTWSGRSPQGLDTMWTGSSHSPRSGQEQKRLWSLILCCEGSDWSSYHHTKDHRGREWEVFLLLRWYETCPSW